MVTMDTPVVPARAPRTPDEIAKIVETLRKSNALYLRDGDFELRLAEPDHYARVGAVIEDR